MSLQSVYLRGCDQLFRQVFFPTRANAVSLWGSFSRLAAEHKNRDGPFSVGMRSPLSHEIPRGCRRHSADRAKPRSSRRSALPPPHPPATRNRRSARSLMCPTTRSFERRRGELSGELTQANELDPEAQADCAAPSTSRTSSAQAFAQSRRRSSLTSARRSPGDSESAVVVQR